jgi:hypothetical protein
MRSREDRPNDDPTLDTGHSTLPATMPVAAPFEERVEERGEGAAQAWAAALDGYIAESPTWTQATARGWRPMNPRRLHELTADSSAAGSRPGTEPAMRPGTRSFSEHIVPTVQIHRRSEVREVVGRLVLPIAVLLSTGVVIGAYVGFHADRRAPAAQLVSAARPGAARSAPAPVAIDPASAAAPPLAVAPRAPAAIVAPAPPALVDVRIASTPSGATVTLVDRGRAQLIGNTPIDASVDPSREYDLVFSVAGGPQHVEHLDARATRRIDAVLERDARASTEPPPRRATRPRSEPGVGTLMISSKPPCEIIVDGRATGLTTPQRAIALPAGSHRITLHNREKSIRKTLTVQIAANATEKVIEDLMK